MSVIKTKQLKAINLSIKTNKFCIHPSAIKAYEFSNSKIFQYNLSSLSLSTLKALQQLDPLHVLKVNTKEYYFFSGWLWLNHVFDQNLENVATVIYPNITSKEAESFSWNYLIANELKSCHRKENLVFMSSLINNAPKSIKNDLYENLQPKTFEALSGETASSVKHQRRAYKHKDTIETDSLFSQILGNL
jgi:hypothetical protein